MFLSIAHQRKLQVISVLSSVWLTLGCGQGLERFKHRETQRAPQSSEQTGWIVSNANPEEMASLLDSHPTATFRSLGTHHGLYEVYGVEERDLRAQLGKSVIEPNQWFPLFEGRNGKARDQRLNTMIHQAAMKLAASSSSETVAKCEEGDKGPSAVLDLVSHKVDANALLQVTRGQHVKLSSLRSTSHPESGGPVRAAWVVLAPEGARVPEMMVHGPELNLKAEAMGMYSLALVIQDQKNICGMDRLDFIVTDNTPFQGRSGSSEKTGPGADRSKMYHLDLVKAEESWSLSEGSGITIAVLDSGINYNHPELQNNMAINGGEIPGNGIDDDGNGFVDDVVGYDFHQGDAAPYDDVGHGSHVAGLAAAQTFGLARKAQIISIKGLGITGGDIASIAAGIIYGVDQGARIINLSLGSYAPPSIALMRAAQYAQRKGVLLVAAAGNGHPFTGMGMDTDSVPNFPSALPYPNIVAVAARGSTGPIAMYSNFGRNTVDIIAPGGGGEGDGLISAFLDNPSGMLMAEMSGTSMATPIVSGIAAQVWALNPQLSAVQVRSILLQAGDKKPELQALVTSGRHIDARSALELAQGTFLPLDRP